MNIRILFTILIFFISNSSFSQKGKLPSVPKEIVKNKNFKEIKLSDRLNKLPFTKATKIKIVSFNLEFGEDEVDVIPIGTPEIEKKKPIDFRSRINENNLENFDQIETLDFKEIDKLTDILYNTCSKYIISAHSTPGCYYPRNAILFYDENEKVFEYIEICFECQQLKSKDIDSSEFNEFCKIGFSELQTFFAKSGLETERREK